MPRTKNNYPEIDHIREDLNSLRTNVVELTKHIQKNGAEHKKEISKLLHDQMSEAKKNGRKQFDKQRAHVESRVKDHPMQSVAIAFAGGALASLLLGSRRR